jgi:hypothetical protein
VQNRQITRYWRGAFEFLQRQAVRYRASQILPACLAIAAKLATARAAINCQQDPRGVVAFGRRCWRWQVVEKCGLRYIFGSNCDSLCLVAVG